MTSVKVHLNKCRKSKDGTYPLVFQLIHRRKKKLIYSPYHLLEECFNEKSGRVVSRRSIKPSFSKEINEYIIEMQRELNLVIERFEEQEREFSAADIVDFYKSSHDDSFLQTYMHNLIVILQEEGRFGSASSYQSTLNRILVFQGDNQALCFEDITVRWLNRFVSYLQKEKLKTNTINFYLRILRAVYNRASKEGVAGASTLSPFSKITLGGVRTVKRAIDKPSIAKIAQMDVSNSRIEMARDFFLFSYYTRGMAFVDMAFLKYSDISNDTIHYSRRKTGQPLQVKIIEPLRKIINKYRNDGEYVLPILSSGSKYLYREYRNGLKRYNNQLKNISSSLNFSARLTSYVSRHSWATIAKRGGASVSVISEGLGHSSEKVTYTYLAALDPSIIDAVNDLVTNLY